MKIFTQLVHYTDKKDPSTLRHSTVFSVPIEQNNKLHFKRIPIPQAFSRYNSIKFTDNATLESFLEGDEHEK